MRLDEECGCLNLAPVDTNISNVNPTDLNEHLTLSWTGYVSTTKPYQLQRQRTMNLLTQAIRRVTQTSARVLTNVPPLLRLDGLTNKLASLSLQERCVSLYRMHRTGPHVKDRKKQRPLDGKPFMKGVVLKTLIKKPKKPNSANRKCVLVRLSNGQEKVAYIPGIGHNLQEHNIVLCRVGRVQDCPGVKLKCVRGKYDLGHVIKK